MTTIGILGAGKVGTALARSGPTEHEQRFARRSADAGGWGRRDRRRKSGQMDLTEEEVGRVFYARLLLHVGCIAFSHEAAALFGDDLPVNRAAIRTTSAKGAGLRRADRDDTGDACWQPGWRAPRP
jgi:hypothetical protein